MRGRPRGSLSPGTCPFPRLLPSIFCERSEVGKHVWGLRCLSVFTHTHRCLPSLRLSVVLRAHGPDLGLQSPLTRHRFCGSSIHVSRKGWHMLLNLCFHMAMTSAVFAGGITLTNYQMVCQAVSRGRG